MGDPRNVAHAKKVTQEKQHKAKGAQKTRAPRPAKPGATEQSAAPQQTETPSQPSDSAQSEKSNAVLSKLKELEFHSRANIEKLAELSLTIEEELKQESFAEGIAAVYAAQDAFQSKIVELIGAYETECARLSGSA